jgi:tetratricopeptide (TPR) repeat protein
LKRAQNEYALSLRSFPDVAASHTELGWLASELGDAAAANAALDDAIGLSPRAARPYVLKGVLLARDGRFAEAVEMWKKARSIEPSYPNVDQLIAEAEKRKGEI